MTAYVLGRLFGFLGSSLLLVAGAFWLIKRGQFSFREAVLKPGVVVTSLALALVSAIAQLAPAGGVMPDAEKVSFNSGCIESALARMDRKAAGETCACMITEIESTFTRDQYKKIERQHAKNRRCSA